MLAMQTRNQLKNHFARASVKIAGRLIGQQNLRLRDQRSRQCQPLLFAARKFS